MAKKAKGAKGGKGQGSAMQGMATKHAKGC